MNLQSITLLVGSVFVYGLAAVTPIGRNLSAELVGGENPGSQTAPAGDAPRSGQRLKVTSLHGADGSNQFAGWYDAALEVDCSFAIAADGVWRCLPAGAETGRFFADAACTQRLATLPRGCETPAYAILTDTSVCLGQPRKEVFSLGVAFAGPIAYSVVAGACSAVTSADLVLYDLYLVGDQATPESFVESTLQREP